MYDNVLVKIDKNDNAVLFQNEGILISYIQER
jgi:hypothetical protein